ncbi:MAG: invasin domain 3-containing protein [Bacteroidota bacterium]
MTKPPFLLLCVLMFASAAAFGQATNDFRSITNGNWGDIATWERFDGSAWIPAVSTPTNASNVITIQTTDTVTVAANVSVDQVVVAAAGQVNVDSGRTMTIANGSGTDFTVNGTLNNAGTITTTGTLAFTSTGLYQHNFKTTAGTIPTATWNAGSTCEIIGYTTNTTGPGGLAQAFSNFTWNAPNQTGIISAGGNLATVNGTFLVANTGTGTFRLTTGSTTINLNGDFQLVGGTLAIAGGSGSPNVNVAGTTTITGGTLVMSENTGIGGLNVNGNFSHTAGTITETSSGSGAIRFSKAGVQSYIGGGTMANTINYTVNSGSTLNLGTQALTGSGNYTLSSGGTLGIGSPNGITTTVTGAVGNIQVTGTRTYNTGANYIYNGLAPQVTGNGLPGTVAGFTLANANGIALPGNLITGDVTIEQGALDLNGFGLSVGGNWTNNGGSLVGGSNTVTFTGAAKTIGGTTTTAFPNLAIATGATYTLNTSNSATSLSFPAAATASSLTHLGTSVLTITGDVTITQPSAAVTAGWNINGGSGVVGGNLTLGGTSGTSTRVSAIAVTSGSLTVSGTTTLNTSTSSAVAAISVGTGSISFSTPLLHNEGTLAFTGAGTMNFNGGYNFASGGSATPILTTIANATLNLGGNLTSSATGGLTLHSGSNAVFTDTAIVTATTALTFGNVTLNAPALVTLANNVTVAGNWTNNGGTLDGGSSTITFSGATKIISGSASTSFPILSIPAGASYTMNNSNTGAGLTLLGGATAASFSHGAGANLSITGNATIGQPTTTGITNSWNINQGSASITGNFSIGGTNTSTTRISRVVVTTGTLTIGGNLIFNSPSTVPQTAIVDLSTGGGTGIVNLAGNLVLTNTTGTITPGTSGSVFNYNGSAAGQTVTFGSAIAYHNLHLNNTNGAGATLGAAVTTTNVTGNIRVQSGTFSNGGFAIAGNASRTFEVANNANFQLAGSSGMVTGFGTKSFGSSSTVEYSGTGAQTIAAENYGNLTVSGARTTANVTLASTGVIGIAGTFNPAATFTTGSYIITGSTVSFNGTGNQTVPVFSYNNLTLSNARVANSITLPIGTISVLGTFSPTATFTTGGYITIGSTIQFNGAAQSIPSFPYGSIFTSGTGIKSATGSWTVNENTSISNGTTIDAGSFTHSLKGNINNSGTFVPSTSTISLDGSAHQTLSGNNLTFNNLTLANPAGASLNGINASVNGVLSLANGFMTTGTNTVILGTGGSVNRTSGHVFGNLQKHVATGATMRVFEIGDATTYAPVTVQFASVSTAGMLAARTTAGDHPNIGASGLKSNRTVNRFYSLTNTGTLFTTYAATFTFVAADIDAGANTNIFTVKKYNAPTWSLTTAGTRTATSTQATGLTSFSDFVIGEGGAAFPGTSIVSATPDSILADGSTTASVSVTLRDDLGNNLTTGGDAVALSTTLGNTSSVIDNNNGTYSAILTSSTVAGQAIVKATVNSAQIIDSAIVIFKPGPAAAAASTISANPLVIIANGLSTSTITVQARDVNGNSVLTSAGIAALSTTLGSLSSVVDSGNGRYSAILTSTTTLDTAFITGTLGGQPIGFPAFVVFAEGIPSQVVWTHQPKDTTAGTFIPSNSKPTIEIRDSLGNRVNGATNSVTISIGANPGSGTLSGTISKSAINGIVEFDSLKINKSGTGYTLIASSSGLTAGTSNAFNISPGTATTVTFVQQPTTTIAGQPITPAVGVHLRDAFGNDVPTSGVTVSVSMSSGTGTLAGTLSRQTNAGGVATFDNLSVNQTGSKRLTASSAGLSSSLSSFFTITPAPSVLVSDDFNAFNLNTNVWTFVNPLSDASFSVTGTNTPNAAVSMTVPASVEHIPWAGVNTAARIMQATNNTDFEVETKFLSGMSQRFQLQGIVVEQDSVNYMRFEVHSDGASTRIYLASTVNGVPTQLVNFNITSNNVAPLYLRVRRVGNDWTQFYSLNGIAWNPSGTFTRTMTISKVGLFAGNSGTTSIPAHTGVFDYFFNTASPINPEDGGTAVDSLPPSITNVQIGRNDSTATITWSTDELARSSVAYGLTAAYEIGTVNDTTLKNLHSISLTGLSIQSLYHIRIGSSDASTNLAIHDTTFSTPDSSIVTSDDFNAFVLNNRWTFVNPNGAGTRALIGQNTTNAWLTISVPGGAAHQPWDGGNQAPRIMQPANNRDFEVDIKFESALTQSFQLQGIIIEQDIDDYLRFDFNSNGTNTRVFAARIKNGTGIQKLNSNIGANGITPQWMRVRRLGHLWTQFYSTNGTTWTVAGTFADTLTVTATGPFSGNSGTTPPAHTAIIDYFFKTSAPINPEDGGVAIDGVPPIISNIQTSTTGTTASFTWTTNELATSNVSFGPSSSYENGTASDTVLKTSHAMLVKNLNPASTYHFRVSSADSSDNVTNSNDSTFITGAASTVVSDDFNAFFLDSLLWTYFNPRNDATHSLVNANTDSAALRIVVPGGITHEPWTGGNFGPRVMQAANNTDFEVEVKFDTKVTQRFQLEGILVEQSPTHYLRFDFNSDGTSTKAFAGSIVGTTGTTFVNTTIGTSSAVAAPILMRVRREGNIWTQSYSTNSGSSWVVSGSFTHIIAVDSVGAFIGNTHTTSASTPAHTGRIDYFFNTRSPIVPEDSGFTPDPIPPTISNIQTSTTGTTATVTWTTNEVATSSISFGPTIAYANGTVTDTVLKTSHSIILKNLNPAVLYHFRVSSSDSADNLTNSNDLTFTTGPASTIVSDDFNSFFINPAWTFINPRNDAALALVNTNTDSAWSRIAVPGGISHEPWTGGNFAPRLMQASNNTDFEVEVKFDSRVNTRFQLQGILVEQSPTIYIRFDFNSDGTNAKIFAASFASGTPTTRVNVTIGPNASVPPPMLMRVRREGNLWTQTYSTNSGSTWVTAGSFSYTLAVDSIGAFIGNTNSTPATVPAHTGKIDYFFNTRSPINPEDGGVASMDIVPPIISNVQTVPSVNGFDVSWDTNEPSRSLLQYGQTMSYELGPVSDTNEIFSHTLNVIGLLTGTTYNFRVTATDTASNATVSSNFQVTTLIPETLSVAIVGNGSVSKNPDQAYYIAGDSVTLTAIPDSGWVFTGWTGGVTGTTNPIIVVMNGDTSITATFELAVIPPMFVSLKAFLQGPYDPSGDSMKTDMNALDGIPQLQPYGQSPWNYAGSETVSGIPAGVVDWMLLEIRSAIDSTTVMGRRAAFILSDGSIVDTSGSGPVRFENIMAGNYFVVLRHRNHLSVMTATPIALHGSSSLYDFSTGQSQTFGTAAMRELETGVFGMRSGDGNANGSINATDRETVWRTQNGTTWSYVKSGDFNLDGGIDALDLNFHWRTNSGMVSQVP